MAFRASLELNNKEFDVLFQTMSLVVTRTLKVCPLQAYWVVE